MTLINEIYEEGFITSEYLKIFTLLLSPFAPHVAEEVWEKCRLGENFASVSQWPVFDEAKLQNEEIQIVLQVNGKFRGKISCPCGISKEDVLEKAKNDQTFAKHTAEKEVVKVIYVQDRLLNVVVK